MPPCLPAASVSCDNSGGSTGWGWTGAAASRDKPAALGTRQHLSACHHGLHLARCTSRCFWCLQQQPQDARWSLGAALVWDNLFPTAVTELAREFSKLKITTQTKTMAPPQPQRSDWIKYKPVIATRRTLHRSSLSGTAPEPKSPRAPSRVWCEGPITTGSEEPLPFPAIAWTEKAEPTQSSLQHKTALILTATHNLHKNVGQCKMTHLRTRHCLSVT